ncbi:hypothetical protein CW745_02890 [Psychromonas sp. psych-6C06]|uniref:glycosyl hydrolase family 18 protein n=1 Tax=Psychromonas sp. psych-6C06 TaxID=2058089 RepID=UPI000C337658|nr:glycosyl hydrolase family 18 protein [Psychromonas sp. psych-6C06]PKF63801.1 hypothetical protein CW745_02890 [Psychromonas sp. psych-6C06]
MSVNFKHRPVTAYFPMWHENQQWLQPEMSRLANVDRSVNVVILSFVDPSKQYNGDLTAPICDYFFEGEGKALQEVASLQHLKQAIEHCKKNLDGRKVLLSAGGEIGGEFIDADFKSLALLMTDLGLDGLDLDYEPAGGMTETQAQIETYQDIITDAREALDLLGKQMGIHYLLSCAPTGVGVLTEAQQDTAFISKIDERLQALIDIDEQQQALYVGDINDDPADALSSALSIFNFPSSGKMVEVFLKLSSNPDYDYIGNMVDIVIYQAYNMGSANLLGRILCYESHRALSQELTQLSGQEGFVIMHGSHIGQEAFPRYSHTLTRLKTIYHYICQYGRVNDGASFWAYDQEAKDEQDYLPAHGMGYKTSIEVFKTIAELHTKYDTVNS